MQFVADKFYKIYASVAAILGLLLIGLVVAAHLYQPLNSLIIPYGLSYVTLGIAAAQFIYGFFIFNSVAKKSAWLGGLVASMILSLNIINLIHNTGKFHSIYLIAFGLLTLASGIFGIYAAVGVGFLMTFYFVLFSSREFGNQTIDIYGVSTVIGTYLLSIISYFLWKPFYINPESRQLNQLSGQLRSKQALSEILIQSISDGIIVVDTQGKVSLMNQAAAKMTEWSVDEALGIDVRRVMQLASDKTAEPLTENQHPFSLILIQKQPISQTLQLTGRQKNKIIISLVISPVVIGASKEFLGAVAVFRDISQTHKEAAQRAEFISTASHEMRTPVAAIEGYLALALNENVSKIDSKAREYLDKAHSSTQHLGKLFQDLLTSAKAEDGRLSSKPRVVEMGAYVEQIVDDLRFGAEKKGLTTEFIVGTPQSTIDASHPSAKVVRPLYYCHVDPDRIREVITNLYDNAVKYTDTGKIAVGITGNDQVVQLHITDTGPGIPAEDLSHLFDKFYRVDSSATRTVGGTGLGLFICRKIAELYNGRVWVDSTVGKGSTFYVNLPRLSAQQAAKLQSLEASQSPLADVAPVISKL